MNYSYPWGPSFPDPVLGVIAGTLGVWTLFDYGGEPGPWPLVSSSFGQFDLAGFPKSASYWYRANWLAAVPLADPGRPPIPESHVVRISQSWSQPPAVVVPPVPLPDKCDYTAWQKLCPVDPGAVNWQTEKQCDACCKNHARQLKNLRCDGVNMWPDYCHGVGPSFPNTTNEVAVQVFSDAPRVELLLNGKSMGVQPSPHLAFAEFPAVQYSPGNLTAVALSSSGETLASHTILTAGPPIAIVLSVDCPSPTTGTGEALIADGHDAALIRATVVDVNGVTVADASHLVTFRVTSGPGRVAGVHNGDAKSHEQQTVSFRHAYHGLARAVIRVTADVLSPPLLHQVDVEHGDGTDTVATLAGGGAAAWVDQDIVVQATAAGLTAGTVHVKVSADTALHSPLATAARQLRQPLQFD